MTTLGSAMKAGVSIFPDLSQFGKRLAAGVEKSAKALRPDVTVTAVLNDRAAKLGFADLQKQRDELGRKVAGIRIGLDDKAARARLLDITAAMDKINGRKISPEIDLQGAARFSAQLLRLEVQADRLQEKLRNENIGGRGGPGSKAAAGLAGVSPLLTAGLVLAPAAATLGGAAAAAGLGLAGAFTAGAGALAAFGAVAKPVLGDALKAEQAVEAASNQHAAAVAKITGQYQYAMSVAKTQAQRNAAYAAEQKALNNAQLTQAKAVGLAYAELSPQQIALSKQLGVMAQAWQDLKAAQTPVVASALQPWLKSVTFLTKQLGPVIAQVAPVIGSLGSQFGAIVSSGAFRTFRDFIAQTGSRAVGAAGNALLGLLQAFIVILPKFQPLIQGAVTWLAGLGPAIEKWASSKKTADHIQAFMQWFHDNGPVVVGLLKNAGGALKALAPGLASGGMLELKVISDFLGLVAKLPRSVAKPLAEVAGAALLLAKLPGGQKVISYVINGTLGGIFSKGGGGAAAGEAGAAAGGATGLMARLAPGLKWAVRGGLLVAGAKIALTIAGSAAPQASPADVKNFQKSTPGGVRKFLGFFFGSDVNTANVSAYVKKLFGPTANWGPQQVFDWLRHAVAKQFDNMRHDIAKTWDLVWNNTIGRAQKGLHDVAGSFDTARHDIAHIWDVMTSDLAKLFDIFVLSVGIAWDEIKLECFNAVLFILNTMGKLPGPLGAPFRTAARDISNSMTGVQQDVKNKTQQIQNDINAIHGKNVTVGVFASGGGGMTFTQKVAGAISSGGFSLHSLAGGGLIRMGSGPTADDVPAMLSRGELVVPAGMVAAGAVNHLRGRLPGFAGGGLAGMVPWAQNAETSFTQSAEAAFLRAEAANLRAGVKSAAKSMAGAPNPPGSGVSRWIPTVEKVLGLLGLLSEPFALLTTLSQMNTESGGSPTVVNLTDSNAAAGHPSVGLMQVIAGTFAAYAGPFRNTGPFEYGVSTNGEANIYAGLNYAIHRYGNPGWLGVLGHGHGYAAGGVVADRGAALLRAWQTKRDGGPYAAWGPIPVNPQIDNANAALRRDSTLAGARGLSSSQHKHYLALAGLDRRKVAALTSERGTERAWRTQLGADDVRLASWISAARGIPGLAKNSAGWGSQLARQKATIGDISAMLGLSAAQVAAAVKAGTLGPGGTPLPKITHSYGSDVSDSIGAFLHSVIAPFARGGMAHYASGGMATFDNGGTLVPGENRVWNGTGRNEHLVPAGQPVTVNLNVFAPIGNQAELEAWLVRAIRRHVRATGGNVSRALGQPGTVSGGQRWPTMP